MKESVLAWCLCLQSLVFPETPTTATLDNSKEEERTVLLWRESYERKRQPDRVRCTFRSSLPRSILLPLSFLLSLSSYLPFLLCSRLSTLCLYEEWCNSTDSSPLLCLPLLRDCSLSLPFHLSFPVIFCCLISSSQSSLSHLFFYFLISLLPSSHTAHIRLSASPFVSSSSLFRAAKTRIGLVGRCGS